MIVNLLMARSEQEILLSGAPASWNIPEETEWFDIVTKGCVIITDDTVFEYRGEYPFPNRMTIMVRDGFLPAYSIMDGQCSYIVCMKSIEEAIAYADEMDIEAVFILGSRPLLEAALGSGLVDRIYRFTLGGEEPPDENGVMLVDKTAYIKETTDIKEQMPGSNRFYLLQIFIREESAKKIKRAEEFSLPWSCRKTVGSESLRLHAALPDGVGYATLTKRNRRFALGYCISKDNRYPGLKGMMLLPLSITSEEEAKIRAADFLRAMFRERKAKISEQMRLIDKAMDACGIKDKEGGNDGKE